MVSDDGDRVCSPWRYWHHSSKAREVVRKKGKDVDGESHQLHLPVDPAQHPSECVHHDGHPFQHKYRLLAICWQGMQSHLWPSVGHHQMVLRSRPSQSEGRCGRIGIAGPTAAKRTSGTQHLHSSGVAGGASFLLPACPPCRWKPHLMMYIWGLVTVHTTCL